MTPLAEIPQGCSSKFPPEVPDTTADRARSVGDRNTVERAEMARYIDYESPIVSANARTADNSGVANDTVIATVPSTESGICIEVVEPV